MGKTKIITRLNFPSSTGKGCKRPTSTIREDGGPDGVQISENSRNLSDHQSQHLSQGFP